MREYGIKTLELAWDERLRPLRLVSPIEAMGLCDWVQEAHDKLEHAECKRIKDDQELADNEFREDDEDLLEIYDQGL